VLAVLAGALLVFSGGQIDVLVPLFAVGVFIGFVLCQVGMVRHWRQVRGRAWRVRAVVNGTGAVLTAVAAVVITVTKFVHGAWLIVLVVPLFVVLFTRVRAAYNRIGAELGVGSLPERPHPADTLVVVPVVAITRLASELLSTALGMGHAVVAVHVAYTDEMAEARDMQRDWTNWRPEISLVLLEARHRELGPPLAKFVHDAKVERVIVLIGEVQPARLWERILKNQRGAVLARYLSRTTNAVVCRLRMPLHEGGAGPRDAATHRREQEQAARPR
jgi:hypothetical protein